MMLEPGMLLHHGSYAEISSIDLSKCAPGKDFGRGFYLTTDLEQARRFISTSLKKARALGLVGRDRGHGFVSTFAYEPKGPRPAFFAFQEADEQWLRFVALNRRRALGESLLPLLDRRLLAAEVIAGKVADDTTNPVITAYLNGLYGAVGSEEAAETAIRMLMPERLKDQYCFLSQAAADCLRPVGVTRHDG